MTIKVKAIIGSTSSKSVNLGVVEFLRKKYVGKLEITPVFINDLTMFSVDLESNPPEIVTEFMDNIRDSDAILFAVPEYNYSIPGVLKNAVDWLSRSNFAIKDKPAFMIGASAGVLGTVRAQIHLKQILSNPMLSPALLPGNDVFIGSIQQKVDEIGQLTDQATIDFLDKVVNNFIEFYSKTKAFAELQA
ncbi:NADPH-dependent FMN reductase [Sporosarcina thermotolerans]|uniref:NADPH-dependent FMN reductase n=1 Tax=Sporosarcina thermotolerans TaxID=633404 RepID=A0AAW9A9A8_9BACL|nr:NADPH-dependent FMN reductase [Sporosarcina thermotolerans]MDW0117639.1 NADPH-dependent FMN reductase [Sporosarcina thermotolerans]WHT49264.1 NADPH-dependent FMN reductase [Sporosarcina thermotolerans]